MKIKSKLDPHNKYEHLSVEDLRMSLGSLPSWVMNPTFFEFPLKEALDKQYGFGLFETKGGKVSKDGIFSYPEDPDLYPIAEIIRGDETFYQYQYGIVAIIQKDGSSFVTRMD